MITRDWCDRCGRHWSRQARVSGVVLLGPIVRDQKPSWLADLALKIGFAGPWRVWFWTTYWDSLFPMHKPADQDQVKAAITENLHEPGRMAALQAMIGLSKADTAAIVPQSRVPALIVMGTRDPDFPDPTAEARWLASELHAESLIVEGAGHYPHTEMPERVASKLLSFIDGLRVGNRPVPLKRGDCAVDDPQRRAPLDWRLATRQLARTISRSLSVVA
jgi:pimeloyl-ACP methyl ester carboxylesterase